ncbi:hypothetical protein E4N62_44395 [Streptomyces sp. MNU76]|uniref:hypothetical protein n=1 Tax=Streptomyces sp. MNU76 TaxID=2560026 RepID=UPI001E318FAD|nr:hypothetical protein [Streptomyces sp. MNU76]MCC9711638.1 hypothetical protein [Streptomyces sp. MNU76]
MQELWPQVLEAAKKRRRFTWILLSQNVRVLSYDGATLILAWVNQGALDNFSSSSSRPVLEEAIEEVHNHQVTIESVVQSTPPTLVHPAPESSATQLHVSVAVTAPDPALQPGEPATSTLHRVLGQTAFLMHEQGNNQAAALLADVGNVELGGPGHRSGHSVDAVLIVPAYLVPRFTEDVIAAIQPVFEHVAGRHGLRINGVTAAPALPQIGDDWRQVLQTRLATEASPDQPAQTRAEEATLTLSREGSSADRTPGCTRYGKTTGRRCCRPAAEWPLFDDLPSPVAACFTHLTPEEWAACQQARARATKEYNARWQAEHAARESVEDVPRHAAKLSSTPRPCTSACTSQERAWGHDSDGASVTCAYCGGWVCLSCGQAKVDGAFEFCTDCSKNDSWDDTGPECDGQHEEEADTGPDPHARLTAMVNDLVKATDTTHRQVNARLNRRVGVITRVGADEQVIRRAVGAARVWLDQLVSSD